MNLSARLSRIEQRNGSNDPFAQLSDEELEAAIAALQQSIAEATGMSESAYANFLSERIVDGTIADHMDPAIAQQFITALLREVNGKTRTAYV